MASFNKTPLNVSAIFFFLILGIVLLLNSIKVLPWGIWNILWRFWPLFFGMAVLQVFTRKWPLLSKTVTALGIGIIISVAVFSVSLVNKDVDSFFEPLKPITSEIRKGLGIETGDRLTSLITVKESDFTAISERVIKIQIGAGEFNLRDNPTSDHLIVKSDYYQLFGKPNLTTTVENGILKIDLATEKNLKPLVGVTEQTKYDISIGHPQTPSDFTLEVGAALFNAKFLNANIRNMTISVGAGSAEVNIAEVSVPQKALKIDVGAGTLRLNVPFDTYLKVNYKTGVGSFSIDGQQFVRDGSYTTPKFKVTKDPLLIDVNVGAGVLTIDTSGKI